MLGYAIGLALAVLSAATLVAAERRVGRTLSNHIDIADLEAWPPLSIIKPTYGVDEHTLVNFGSWSQQDYPAPLEIIYSFQVSDDPAIPLAKGMGGPHHSAVVIEPVEDGYSGKMSNLLHGLARARHQLIVMSDSDIRAGKLVCRQLASLHVQGFDVVSCVMRHTGGGNVWGRIYAAFWNYEHMAFIGPSILSHGRDATGGTLSMTRATLVELGGLEAFRDYLAEDVAMGRRAHELGFRVSLGPIVDSPVPSMGLRPLLAKFARAALFGSSMGSWSETLQYVVIMGYLVVLPLGLALGDRGLLLGATAMALLRLLFASRFVRRTGLSDRLFPEIYLSDMLFLLVFVRSALNRTVEWGGVRYRVTGDGRMVRT